MSKSVPEVSKSVPEVGEVFQLTLDGDALENQSLQIFGDCQKGEWKHNGLAVNGTQTRNFKLAQCGLQPNLDGVKTALPASRIEGQWIKAFNAVYTEPDGKGPIGIADDSWSILNEKGTLFPFIDTDGKLVLRFNWSNYEVGAEWRWLVQAE